MTEVSASTAARAARRFRVERTDEGIVLVDGQNAEHRVEVRRALVHLTVKARVLRVCESLVPGGLQRWLTLDDMELLLGSEGDFSELSVWSDDEPERYNAENKIFGIDNADLEHLAVTHARVVDLEARDRYDYPYIDRSAGSAENHEEDDHGPVADLWYHTGEDDTGYRWSALVLTVGFPEPQFSELMDACISGRADTLVLECGFYAKTTGWALQSARDLILSPEESVRLHIEEATMSAPVLTGATARAARVKEGDGEDASHDGGWDRERDQSVPLAIGPWGHVLLGATITVSGLLALFGAGAGVVLIIAILGVAAALIATLRAIGNNIIVRLTLLSERKVQGGPR